jgi:MFS family permease
MVTLRLQWDAHQIYGHFKPPSTHAVHPANLLMQAPEITRPASSLSAYWLRIATVWTYIPFRWYWLSSSTQSVAQATQFLVIGWLVLEISGSSAQLGLVIFMYGVPNVSFLLVAGVVADRFDRRYILITTQAAVGGVIVALAVLEIAGLVATWHIYIASALLGVIQSLNMPARMTMIADLVEERSILDAVAMQNAATHAGRIVGPPIAGVIIEVWGVGAGLAAIAACYVVSIACVAKIGHTSQSTPSRDRSPFRNFADGISYIKNNPVVLTVIVITCAFGGFGMSHMQVVPAMAKDVLGSGSAGVGLLFLGSGIGSFVGSLLLPAMGRAHVYRALLLSLLLFVLFLSLFAWSTWFWVTWAFFLLVGVTGVGMVWPLATTIIQVESSAEVRGRVMGILQLTPGFHYLGAFPLALAAGQWGWGVAITGAAGLSLAVTLWFALARGGAPKLRPQTTEAI